MEVVTRIGCAAVVLTLSACSSQQSMDSERITRFDGQVLHVGVTAADGTRERFNTARDTWHT